MDERWKPIEGYESLYEVSNCGRIKSIKRQGTDGRILKIKNDKKGYCLVSLCKNSSYKTHLVHRLVAEAFIDNDNPDIKTCINHKDENKLNNKVDNLEWCTYSYNNIYGTAKERASITRYKPCRAIFQDGSIKEYNSCTLASKDTGISQGNIWGACNKLWNTAGGLVWEYV